MRVLDNNFELGFNSKNEFIARDTLWVNDFAYCPIKIQKAPYSRGPFYNSSEKRRQNLYMKVSYRRLDKYGCRENWSKGDPHPFYLQNSMSQQKFYKNSTVLPSTSLLKHDNILKGYFDPLLPLPLTKRFRCKFAKISRYLFMKNCSKHLTLS